MERRWAEFIREGMDVVGEDGGKIGRVEAVFHAQDRRGEANPAASAHTTTATQLFMRVATGFLGLGHRVYVPESAVRTVRDDQIVLTVDKAEVDRLGWGRQPSHVTEQDYGGDVPTAAAAVDTETGSARLSEPAAGATSLPGGPTAAEPEPRPREGVHTLGPGEAERTLELRGEELVAHKEAVQTGEVEIHKRLVTEMRTVEVPVAREEVVVERHPVQRTADAAEAAGLAPAGSADADEIRIPVVEEELVIEKRPVVKEEVVVSKRRTEENRRLSDTVRREDVVVDDDGLEGNVTLRGTTEGQREDMG